MTNTEDFKTLAFIIAIVGVSSIAGHYGGLWCDAFFFLSGWLVFNTWCKRRPKGEDIQNIQCYIGRKE